MIRYIDILKRHGEAIARMTFLGMLLTIAFAGFSSARAASSDWQADVPQVELDYRFELSDRDPATFGLGRKPTRARRRPTIIR